MGMFHFFKKRKEKKQLDEVVKRYESEVLLEEQKEDQEIVRRYVLEQCEVMTELTTDYVNAKSEYETVTSYLTDIQTIEEGMDEPDQEKLLEIAENIMHLTQAKDDMLSKVNRLPDSQYNQMERHKDEIPKAIVRLQANEKTQEMIRRDLDYLEGEKVEWTYEKTAIKSEQRIIKRVSIAVMSLLALLVLAFFGAAFLNETQASSVLIVAVLIVAVIESMLLVRIQNNKTLIKQCSANYNKAVSIQNSVKYKYVNVTNAVDYAHELYNVKSAKDFEVKWQLYLEAVKEREKLSRANDDLSYYQEMMVELLRLYRLFDASIWPYQAVAIVDPKEMVEVKHALFERRQKIRNRIEGSMKTIEEAKSRVEQLCMQQKMMTPQIRGILESVDKILNK